MPVPKLEEFKAPWETEAGDDAEIDKPKLKKYIHSLLVDKDKAQTARDKAVGERDTLKKEAEDKSREGESEVDRLKRENEELRSKGSQESPETLKLRVAVRKHLTEVQAKRLIGETEEELEADADELVKSFGGSGEAGEGEETPRRQPRRVNNGSDPDLEDEPDVPIEKALEQIRRL